MPARDTYHDMVKHALVKEGWSITHDPYRLPWGKRDLYVDLGAEKLLAAEKAGRKIAVEIKSFMGPSLLNDLEKAVGQFVLYRELIAVKEPGRVLYLGIPRKALKEIVEEQLSEVLLENLHTRILVFDPTEEVIVEWIPLADTES